MGPLVTQVKQVKEVYDYDIRRAAEDAAREIARKEQEKKEKPRG